MNANTYVFLYIGNLPRICAAQTCALIQSQIPNPHWARVESVDQPSHSEKRPVLKKYIYSKYNIRYTCVCVCLYTRPTAVYVLLCSITYTKILSKLDKCHLRIFFL